MIVSKYKTVFISQIHRIKQMKWILLSIVLLVSLEFVLAMGELKPDTDVYYSRALNALENQRIENAIVLYDKVLDIDPEHVDSLFDKGRLLVYLNQTDEGMALIDHALSIEPKNTKILNYKGNLQAKNENFDDALMYAEAVLELNPDDVTAITHKGDWFAKNGNPDDAISYYERALELNPNFVDIFGKYNFDKILELDSENLDALNAKGASLVSLGRSSQGYTVVYIDYVDDAISYFDRVLEKNPNHIGALFNKGRALAQLNQTTETLSYIDKILEIEPDNLDAIVYKGDRLINQNKDQEGEVFIKKALQINPNHTQALFNEGILLTKQQNFYDALTIFDKILQKDPENELVALNLHITASRVGYITEDGFMETIVHDSEGRVAAHLRIPELKIVNHTISTSLIDEWPITKIVKRDGQDYEVHQYNTTSEYRIHTLRGGALHYGIPYEPNESVWRVYANYWQYLVNPGDTITFVYTAFRPVA